MHPAYAVILFTTASGAGYGLLVWLSLLAICDVIFPARWFGVASFGVAFSLITAGLLASTAHLGRPERAWRAFSQWRTSWLSREGVMATTTYIPAGFLAIGWIMFQQLLMLTAILTIVCALLTLYTTGMIYASLRTIRQWHQPLTSPIYIAIGLASGAVLLNLLLQLSGSGGPVIAWLAIACLATAAALKWAYWRRIDGELRTYTAEAATGLGRFGKVRQLEPPHTQPNFVMREMGYAIARKHALKLRETVMIFAFAVPIAALLLTALPHGAASVGGAIIAFVSIALGVLVERWLFFAEAEHVSMLYYGAETA
jgi:sulfite dehydrogenase (quinone) subunit SoeC